MYKKEVPYILVIIMIVLAPLLFVPFFNHSFTQGKGLFFVFMVLLLGLFFVFMQIKPRFKINRIANSNILFALLAMYSMFTVVNSFTMHPEIVFFGSISRGLGFNIYFLCIVLSLIVAFFLKEKHIKNLLKLSLIPAVLNSVYAFFQRSGHELFFQNYGFDIFNGRAFGLYGNPSYLGQALSLFLIVALFFIFTSKKKYKIYMYISTAIIIFFGIIVSGTRTSILGLFGAGCLILLKLFFQKIYISKKKIILIIMTCIVIIATATLYAPSRFSFSPIAMRSLNSRIEIWKGAVELISRKPIIGYGTNTFQIYFPDVISKDFYALEENLTLNVDKVHNEFLEILFQYGFLGGIMYVVFLTVVFLTFLKSKKPLETILTLLILTYHIQNQVSFPDISIMMFIFICYGGVSTIGVKQKIINNTYYLKKIIYILLILFFVGFFTYTSFYNPLRAELLYTKSQNARSTNYDSAVLNLKEAIGYMPYYTEFWYELMMIDPSSRQRGLHYLQQIEGDTGNVNAWMGNLYLKTDPTLATEYYLKALKRNPYHPNWIRAFADMLYYYEDYENALFMYSKYLEAIPDIWYVDENDQDNELVKKKARIFLKNTPYLNDVFEKIEFIENFSIKDL